MYIEDVNIDHILETLNRRGVSYLVVGGMNYLLRHEPVLTYDLDIWIRDSEDNRIRCESALAELDAAWGESESSWGPVARQPAGWLGRQSVFCLTSPYGALDVFRQIKGLDSWEQSRAGSYEGCTAAGISYRGLSDEDMLRCQEALPKADQKPERIRRLRKALGRESD